MSLNLTIIIIIRYQIYFISIKITISNPFAFCPNLVNQLARCQLPPDFCNHIFLLIDWISGWRQDQCCNFLNSIEPIWKLYFSYCWNFLILKGKLGDSPLWKKVGNTLYSDELSIIIFLTYWNHMQYFSL